MELPARDSDGLELRQLGLCPTRLAGERRETDPVGLPTTLNGLTYRTIGSESSRTNFRLDVQETVQLTLLT